MSRRRTIERTFQGVSVLVGVAITLVLVYLAYLTIELDKTNDQEGRSARVVSYTLALQLRTVDLETAQRGYVLTGDRSFLEPFNLALERIETTEKPLLGFVEDDPNQRKRLEAAVDGVHAYIDDFAKPNIDLAKTDREAARENVASQRGKRQIDSLREQFTEIIAVERARRDDRAEQSDRLADRAKVATGAGIAVILLVLALFHSFIGRSVVRPMRELRDVVVRIAGGDLSARPPRHYNGEAEDLAESVTTMTEELQLAHATIERRAEEIQEHARALERSNTDLEQFAYAAAHDLQEPLRMVASYTGLIERRYKGQLDDDADEFIRYAVDGAKRMQRLINDLLTYSRVNSSAGASTEDVAVADAAQEALENLTARVEDRDATVEVDIDDSAVVRAQRGQLIMLLQNLLGNALRFAGEGNPTVRIEVRVAGDQVIGMVDDDGPGIEEQYRERVFRIFQRLGERDEHAGTGIGLALCKRIVERYGGTIEVQDAPIGGARFRFDLPAARAPRVPATASATTENHT